MISQVITYPDSSLYKPSSLIRRVNASELKEIIEDMKDTMKAYGGVGLAGPQVGYHKRVIIVKDYRNESDVIVLINPKIKILTQEKISSLEGCLSVPADPTEIPRYNSIEISGLVPTFFNDTVEFFSWTDTVTGFPAAVFQHEVDHLEGKLFFEHLKPVARDLYIRKIKKNISRGQSWRYQVTK